MTRWRRTSLLSVYAIVVALAVAPLAQGRAGGAASPAQLPVNPNEAPLVAGTSAISGVVIDGATKAPIAGAIVYLGPPQHGPPDTPVRTLTDARGRYVFRNLPAFGGYFLQATKSGYFTAYYGRSGSVSFSARIALADGQWFGDGNLTMWRPGAISGRVIDHTGEPVVGVYVRVLARVLIAGRPQLAAGAVTTTDDRGAYRIGGLQPATYVVQVPSVQSSVPGSLQLAGATTAVAEGGRPVGRRDAVQETAGTRVYLGRYTTPLAPIDGRTAVYPPTFHPDATAIAGARTIDLGRSEERSGVDVLLRAVPSHTVSGVLEGPGDALVNLLIRLMPSGVEDLGTGSEAATALVGPDGRFTFLNVPAGTYTLITGRSTTEYGFRDVANQSKELPRPPMPAAARPSMSGMVGIGGQSGAALQSWRYADEPETHTARQQVIVAADRLDLVVTLKRMASLTGRIVWPDDEKRPDPPAGTPDFSSRPRATLYPAGGEAWLGLPRSATPRGGELADRFVIHGVLPGEYLLSVSDPAVSGRIRSITWNGHDYTNRPFDASSGADIVDVVVTMTTRAAQLSGTVVTDRNLPLGDAAVILFPTERDQWRNFGLQPDRLRTVVTTNTGAYRFQSLPAGEYFVIAVQGDQAGGWMDPAFLEKQSRIATRFSIAWGEVKAQDLRLSVVK
jgi:hypothetical protein